MLTIEQPPTINTGLAARLFDAFNRQQIVYCHWKSNEQLAAGLKGETDLDLLVERASFTAAVAILLQLGFKQAAVRWGPRTPGVLHLYAFDPAAAGLIHVHLYSHLLTGESLVKTHVLPCESMLLDKGDCIGQVRVPAKEAEAAMYVLRAFIKNGSLLHTLLHGRGGGHNQLAEFWFPAEGIDADSAYRVLHEHYPVVGRRLFTECYRALAEDRSATRKWLLGLRIRHCLRGSARHTYPARLLAYAGLISAKLRRIAHGKVKNKVLDSGGAVIAFIGADATGKSTLVAETARWLSSNLAVRTMHVGKPPGTWLTAPLHVLLPVARCLFPGQRHQARQAAEASPRKSSCDKPKNSTSLLYAIRAVSLAFERARLLRRIHRYAAAGEIVICDRYPSDTPGATDGPRLQVRGGQRGWRARLFNWLARHEQRLYVRNAPPDVALRLNVSIETAKRRNRQRTKADKHDDDNLEIRHQQCRVWKKTGSKVVHDIDTEASLELTILSVKKNIWNSL